MGREREREQERVLFPAYTRLGWEGEDWGGGDSPFQGIESLLFGQAPDPSLGFAGEGIGAGNIREVTDELLIAVHKAKEGLDLLYLCQGSPFHDSTDLHAIYGSVVFEMTNPRYSTSFHLNFHFSGLINSLCSHR